MVGQCNAVDWNVDIVLNMLKTYAHIKEMFDIETHLENTNASRIL